MVKIIASANSKKGRKLHRLLGITVALYVLMASSSGMIHILMTNFFSAPPPVVPQGVMQLQQASLPLSVLVTRLPNPTFLVKAVNIRTIQGELWYQFIQEGQERPVYVHAKSGKVNNGMDEIYAKQIAVEYLRTQKLVQNSAYVTAFTDEYLNIFRVLPVYRFEVTGKKAERVYVSTVTGSVTLYLNTMRALGQHSFSYLHKLAFIPHKALRDILQAMLVIGIILTTCIGVGIFIARLIRQKP